MVGTGPGHWPGALAYPGEQRMGYTGSSESEQNLRIPTHSVTACAISGGVEIPSFGNGFKLRGPTCTTNLKVSIYPRIAEDYGVTG